jgi:hypothetical protein
MDNAKVIIVNRSMYDSAGNLDPTYSTEIPVCDRGHDPHKMICTKECEAMHRFLCQKCLMRVFIVQQWLVDLILIDIENNKVPEIINQKCPRCGFITSNIFNCPVCKNPDILFREHGVSPEPPESTPQPPQGGSGVRPK